MWTYENNRVAHAGRFGVAHARRVDPVLADEYY